MGGTLTRISKNMNVPSLSDAVLTLPDTGNLASLGEQKDLIINKPKSGTTYDDLGYRARQ